MRRSGIAPRDRIVRGVLRTLGSLPRPLQLLLTGIAAWRWLHRWTLAVYLLAVAHTLGSGSDARSTWLLALLGVTSIPIVFIGVHRFLPPEKRRREGPPVVATADHQVAMVRVNARAQSKLSMP